MERKNIGYASIAIGVLAWPVGLGILKLEAIKVLPFHLFFIFLGIYLKRKS